jgi:hypothetical protein
MSILSKKNLSSFDLLIFDNSRSEEIRKINQGICQKHGVLYLSLPYNITRHANRSHGMAMSWVYHRIIRFCSPEWFGFIDHDLIPVAKIFDQFLRDGNSFYGVLRENRKTPGVWSLWAGYCFFNYQKTKDLSLNFLYDFSRNLDTGGRNWYQLYSSYDKKNVTFASEEFLHVPYGDMSHEVQLIDKSWVHIGGVSYSNNLNKQLAFYQQSFARLTSGESVGEVFSIK